MTLPDTLLRDIREAQDSALSASSCVPEVRARMPVRPPAPKRKIRRSRVLIAGSALLFAAGLGFGVISFLSGGAGLKNEHDISFAVGPTGDVGQVGAWIAADDAELPLRFSDGTLVALEQGARARVAGVDTVGAHIILERGVATASVVHTQKSHWRLDVGPFDVSVIGTRFDVSWNPNEEVLVLHLYEGAVVVGGSFLGEPRVVGKGQTLHAFCKQRRAEILEVPLPDAARALPSGSASSLATLDVPGEASVAGSAAGVALSTSREGRETPAIEAPTGLGAGPSGLADRSEHRAADLHARHAAVLPSDASGWQGGWQSGWQSSWQKLATAGKLRDAWRLVEQSGFDAECSRASGADLVLLGDVARFAGDASRAERAYVSARTKLPGGGRSAYGLGLLAFDQRKDFADAARWFEVYLHEQPQGALRREAEGRLIEAWQRTGDRAHARSMAEKYLVDFPDGAHAALAHQLVGR